jgi:hypothetical protein
MVLSASLFFRRSLQQRGVSSLDQLQAKLEGWLLKQKAGSLGGWKRRYVEADKPIALCFFSTNLSFDFIFTNKQTLQMVCIERSCTLLL